MSKKLTMMKAVGYNKYLPIEHTESLIDEVYLSLPHKVVIFSLK